MSPVVSAAIGFGGGLMIAVVGKAIDYWRQARSRELDIATLVGELRSGFAALQLRQQVVESRISKLCERLGELTRRFDVHDATEPRIVHGGKSNGR